MSKGKNNLLKVISVVAIALLAIIGIKVITNNNEKEFLAAERKRMESYLSEKYKQEFEVEKVEKEYLGFLGEGTMLKAKCKDNNLVEFNISRNTSSEVYEEDYSEQWLATDLYDVALEYGKGINEDAKVTLDCYYKGKPENITAQNVNKNDVHLNAVIVIPENPGFSKDTYNPSILKLVDKLYSEGYYYFEIKVKFYDEAFEEGVNNYLAIKDDESVDEKKRLKLEEVYNNAELSGFTYFNSDKEKLAAENMSQWWHDHE